MPLQTQSNERNVYIVIQLRVPYLGPSTLK
jgi:hypothetical protein